MLDALLVHQSETCLWEEILYIDELEIKCIFKKRGGMTPFPRHKPAGTMTRAGVVGLAVAIGSGAACCGRAAGIG